MDHLMHEVQRINRCGADACWHAIAALSRAQASKLAARKPWRLAEAARRVLMRRMRCSRREFTRATRQVLHEDAAGRKESSSWCSCFRSSQAPEAVDVRMPIRHLLCLHPLFLVAG